LQLRVIVIEVAACAVWHWHIDSSGGSTH